jgi:hypothetical protein
MFGVVALAVGALIAAFAISTYQPWWSILFVALGVIVLAIERSTLRGKDAVLTSTALAGSLVLGAAGSWMVLLGMFGAARPCDACFDNRVLLLPGLGVVALAVIVASVSIRSVARAFRSRPSDMPRP